VVCQGAQERARLGHNPHSNSKEPWTKHFLLALLAVTLLGACAPEVGSKAWCEKMQQKSKGDWTANEAADYAKSCLFK
jgi:hypothetical protein